MMLLAIQCHVISKLILTGAILIDSIQIKILQLLVPCVLHIVCLLLATALQHFSLLTSSLGQALQYKLVAIAPLAIPVAGLPA